MFTLPQERSYPGAVELHIADRAEQRGVLWKARFESIEELRAALDHGLDCELRCTDIVVPRFRDGGLGTRLAWQAITPGRDHGGRTTVDAGGAARVCTAAGDYVIIVAGPAEAAGATAIGVGVVHGLGTPSAEPLQWAVELPGTEELGVRCVDRNGLPILGADVSFRLLGTDGETLHSGRFGAPSDENGHAQAPGLVPGHYIVRADRRLDGAAVSGALHVDVPCPRADVILRSRTRVGFDVSVSIPGMADMVPCISVHVRESTGTGWRELRTDPGTWVVEGLLPGDHEFAVWSEPWGGMTRGTIADTSAIQSIPVRLDWHNAIPGCVRDPLGQPVRGGFVELVGSALPWERAVTGADGRYCVWLRTSSGAPLLLRAVSNGKEVVRTTAQPGAEIELRAVR